MTVQPRVVARNGVQSGEFGEAGTKISAHNAKPCSEVGTWGLVGGQNRIE